MSFRNWFIAYVIVCMAAVAGVSFVRDRLMPLQEELTTRSRQYADGLDTGP